MEKTIIELEDYYGNTQNSIEFETESRIDPKKVKVDGYAFADEEEEDGITHIRMQLE